ncbi:MAG TPA: spore germination protein, partial [Clostridia bacterium]|nr:spore germination protein [Clostridia bacterium]
ISEIKIRLNRIHTDAVLESGYIEAFIEDAPFSIFSTVGNSEKPDTAAAKILEGRAAILVDGTPFVLTVPMLFIESFQSSEDYYSRPFYSSLVRAIRYLGYFITIIAPAAYVALTTFHQELIPTLLLFTVAAGHEGIPFTSVIEALIMIVIFEILREAGVRLPKPIGSAVSIVGALVIGESAVSAGLIGPIMVIVVALTAISSFVIPAQTDSASILRYFLLILAGLIGGFGIIMGVLLVFIHLASLRSFGTPYLSPIAPFVPTDMKDSFIRMSLRKMVTRPSLIGSNRYRQKTSDLYNSSTDEENDNNS